MVASCGFQTGCVGVALAAVLIAAPLRTQEASRDTLRSELVRVFVDCQSFGCDDEFFRTEITWVNFVRDRTVAQVHVLVTAEQTGGGGRAFTVTFDGLGDRAGIRDSLSYASSQVDTQDEMRQGLARTLAQGLTRFVRGTAVANRLRITLTPSSDTSAVGGEARGARDPWKAWVFSLSAYGFGNGDDTYKSSQLFGSVEANRVTEQWKTNLSVQGDYSENRYDLGEGRKLATYQHSFTIASLLVKSLGPHWSGGVNGSYRVSKFENLNRAIRFSPALEYDLFPYKESTRRQLVVRYGPGVRHFSYDSITIFGKKHETKADHELTMASELRQKWGTLSVGVTGSQYLDDLSKRRLTTSGNVSWRVVRGLELNVGGFYALTRDQLNIARGELTGEDILVRLRQLQSGYQYFASVGLSYTFGSIYNNVVNPRFGRGNQSFTIGF